MTPEQLIEADRQHVWHPYSAQASSLPVFPVASAHGCLIKLADGRELLDGMSSWWSVIHGYNHPVLNSAITSQLNKMAHIMFGGLTHEPAVTLATKLARLTPEPLEHVFFSDSGSVSVEVAMKMALQYCHASGDSHRNRFMALKGGYHGDTFMAMSVCDPDTGMHHLFTPVLPEQIFAERPKTRFGSFCTDKELTQLTSLFRQHGHTLAAVILEPIVQGAGGMWFYSADYLHAVRRLCNEYGVLLIADEIATGFGRTGKLFACEHANITPDILCLGKALTGGYITLAATLCTRHISQTISSGDAGALMHGPTFMGNPLACSVANASIDLLLSYPWQDSVTRIETGLRHGLQVLADLDGIHDVRVLGAIGVVELKEPVDMRIMQPLFVEHGIWVRPFGKLVYLMPPYCISSEQLATLTQHCALVLQRYLQCRSPFR
jgi:adenosylmethionine-8-amino-7-oxononanoate aminotransferase